MKELPEGVSQLNFRINTSKGSENAVTSPRGCNTRFFFFFFHSKKQPNKAKHLLKEEGCSKSSDTFASSASLMACLVISVF